MSSGMMTDTLAGPGAQLWAERYTGAGNSVDLARSVAVSPAGGTVFVTGYSGKTLSGYDYATVAYNTAIGTEQWAKRYTGISSSNTAASSLAVSPAGKAVFIAGESYDGSASGEDYTTVAYHG